MRPIPILPALAAMPALLAQEGPGGLDAFKALLATKVESASRQVEPLREAPVPVTIITREMMDKSGARTLQELMVAYVPGMTAVEDQNEINLAMHGIYASSQQKILVLLNGHRLNSRAYAMANLDFSMSLDKLARVEVLRGPGSSLYGNVALTAVINLVTKKPWDVQATQAILGVGSYGQRQLSFLMGHNAPGDQELMVWGSWYTSQGESRAIPASEDYSRLPKDGSALLGAFRDRPSHDVGLTYKMGNVTLLANRRYAHYVEPFSDGGPTGEVYAYGDYQPLLGVGPGLGSLTHTLGLSLARTVGQWAVNVELGFDTNEVMGVIVTDPATRSMAAPSWAEKATTLRTDFSRAYEGLGGSGTLLAGVELDRLDLTESTFPRGSQGNWTAFGDTRQVPLLEAGSELSTSGFGQVKHYVSSSHIFNVGLRWDHKRRHQGAPVQDLSPRLAWIWLPTEDFELKASYARSFVDAPYWYRYNSLPSYRGGVNLRPEHLEAFQLTPSWTSPDGRTRATLNLFLNHLKDFVYRNNQAPATEPIYTNAGRLKTWGTELEVGWLGQDLQLRGQATWQRVLRSESFLAAQGRMDNVPPVAVHLSADFKAWEGPRSTLWAHLQVHHTSRQRSPIEITFPANAGPVPSPAVSYLDPGHETPAAHVVDVGLRWTGLFGPRSSLDLRAWNALDAHYRQGGSTTFPYPQPGRWLLLRVGFNLDPILGVR